MQRETESDPPQPLETDAIVDDDEKYREYLSQEKTFLATRILNLENEMKKRNQQRRVMNPPGTDAVLTTLRAYYKVMLSHHKFVQRWSTGARDPKTLDLRKSLYEWSNRVFEEFCEMYSAYIQDLSIALQPPKKIVSEKQISPSKEEEEDDEYHELKPKKKVASRESKKRRAIEEIENEEEDFSKKKRKITKK